MYRLFLAAIAVTAFAAGANAIPIQLDSAQFALGISGLPTQVEDFERFSPGPKGSPFRFANGTYSASPGTQG